MISRRSLLTNSAIGAVALAAAVAAGELPALAENGNGHGDNNHRGDNEGRNRDRNRRSNRGNRRRRNKGRNNGNNGNHNNGNGGRGNANGGFVGDEPTMKDVVIDGNGDPSDNLEQKRDRRHNRKERRRD